MLQLPWEDLDDWISDQSGRKPPPIFQLEPAQGAVEAFDRSGIANQLAGLHGSGRPVRESGVIEFRLDITLADINTHYLMSQLRDICRMVDDREYLGDVAEDVDEHSLVHVEMISRIREEDLDVIGPGGTLTLSRRREGLVGDLVVRKREGPRRERGNWQRPDEVSRRVRALRTSSDVELSVSFGYFEASKYEPQDLLRPAYLFVVDRPQPEERGVGWRTVVVEPATAPPELLPWRGLENWFEEE